MRSAANWIISCFAGHTASLQLSVPPVVASTEELQKLAENCIAWNDDFFTFYADASVYALYMPFMCTTTSSLFSCTVTCALSHFPLHPLTYTLLAHSPSSVPHTVRSLPLAHFQSTAGVCQVSSSAEELCGLLLEPL